MRLLIFLLLTIISQVALSQSKGQYLKNNRFNITAQNFKFPQNDFKIIGYGAFHGSQSTEKAENIILETLVKDKIIKYYLPETDFSIANYFNDYLKSGDTLLLKQLVKEYGKRVPQESSVETYRKWIGIKKINDIQDQGNKLEVVGIDLIVSYKYTARQLLELTNLQKGIYPSVDRLIEMVDKDTSDYSPNDKNYAKAVMKSFVDNYEHNQAEFHAKIKNQAFFDHIIINLKYTFEGAEKVSRDQTMFNNYTSLSKIYSFKTKPQFLRMGFFHLEKSKEGNSASFFTKLIENGVYSRNEVISVIGYLTKSRVLWDVKYDKDKKYVSYTTEGGYGIGDYWKEYFKGINKLKNNKISDLTLFRLNKENSPYKSIGTDLMEVKLFLKKSNKESFKGRSPAEYLDYAILISNSAANRPIEEIMK